MRDDPSYTNLHEVLVQAAEDLGIYADAVEIDVAQRTIRPGFTDRGGTEHNTVVGYHIKFRASYHVEQEGDPLDIDTSFIEPPEEDVVEFEVDDSPALDGDDDM